MFSSVRSGCTDNYRDLAAFVKPPLCPFVQASLISVRINFFNLFSRANRYTIRSPITDLEPSTTNHIDVCPIFYQRRQFFSRKWDYLKKERKVEEMLRDESLRNIQVEENERSRILQLWCKIFKTKILWRSILYIVGISRFSASL